MNIWLSIKLYINSQETIFILEAIIKVDRREGTEDAPIGSEVEAGADVDVAGVL